MLKIKEFKTSSSKSCITISAMTGNNGDPIGVPKSCLYVTPSNMKNVDVSMNFIASMNSSLGILSSTHFNKIPSLSNSIYG